MKKSAILISILRVGNLKAAKGEGMKEILTCRNTDRSSEFESVLFAELCDIERSNDPRDFMLPLNLRNFMDEE